MKNPPKTQTRMVRMVKTQTQTPLPLVQKRTSTIRAQEEPTATENRTLADMEVEAAMILQTTQMKMETTQMKTETTQMKMTTGTRVKMRMRRMVATEMETLRKPLTRRE